jgi:hypothetical protein
MGSIRTFDIKQIQEKRNINTFIETGTLHGDGVDYALEVGYKNIISIEINEQLASAAKDKYKNEPRVTIYCGNSPDVLRDILPNIKEPVVFWLDAHFPGGDARLAEYKDELDPDKNVPLEVELSLISNRGYDDVIICDDLWIYEDWQSPGWGTFNEHCRSHGHNITREELVKDGMPEVFKQLFINTHEMSRVYSDQGFLVFKPKTSKLNNFSKMRVINDFSKNYPEDPIRFWNFNEFEEKANECILFIGGWPHPHLIKENADVPKYFFSTEEQTWAIDGTDQFVPFVDQIFTITPPRFTNREKRTGVFFPFNKKYIPEITEKIYSVIYTGFHGGEAHINEIIDTITQVPNYRYTSFSGDPRVTNSNVMFLEKLKIISQTKVSVIHNVVNSSPQLKSRAFEAGFSRSLILAMKDEFGLIEDWFVPDVDFIYYEQGKLKEKLEQVLQNYDSYKHIIENAYIKCVNEYTTEKFVEKYIGWKK